MGEEKKERKRERGRCRRTWLHVFEFLFLSFVNSSLSIPHPPSPPALSQSLLPPTRLLFLCLWSVIALLLVNMTLFKVLRGGWQCTEEINLAACHCTCPPALPFLFPLKITEDHMRHRNGPRCVIYTAVGESETVLPSRYHTSKTMSCVWEVTIHAYAWVFCHTNSFYLWSYFERNWEFVSCCRFVFAGVLLR